MTLPGRRGDRPRVPALLSTGLLLNATFAGLLSVALPLWLSDRGVGKTGIAVFFLTSAAFAAALNLLAGRRERDASRLVGGATAMSCCGLAVLSFAPWNWTVFPAGAATMAMSLVYPQYMAEAQRSARVDAQVSVVAFVRSLYVVGYVAGLGAFTLFRFLEQYASGLRPVNGALLLGLLGFCTALLRHRAAPGAARAAERDTPADPPPDDPGAAERTPAPARPHPGRWVLPSTVSAIVLLRAADSLRGVYLPLYALHTGWTEQWVSGLFAVTVVVEVAVLGPLGRMGDRFDNSALLTVFGLTGGVAFLLVVADGGVPLLIASQVVYAVFTAGFQVVGITMLGTMLKTGAAGGASLYTAAMQIGSAAGVLAPLAVEGYSAGIFAIAAGFCLVSSLLLVTCLPAVVRRYGRPADTPVVDGTAASQ